MPGPPVPLGIRPSTSYLPELESLRGIAVALVFVFHLHHFVISVLQQLAPKEVSPWQAFIRAGNTGVSLFFVLSGFLLSRPFFREAAGGPRVSRGHFYRRRALRILPLYYVAVAIGAVLSARQIADLWHGVPYLFFLNGIPGFATPLAPYSSVWWSLATEAQFYALLPLLPLLLRSRRGRIVGAAIALVYAAAYAEYLGRRLQMATIGAQIQLALSLFGRAPQFLAGMLAAWIYDGFGPRIREALAGRKWVRSFGSDAAFLALLGALALLLQWAVAQGPTRLEAPPYQVWHVVEGACWAAILFLLVVAPLRVRPLFCNPVLEGLGVLSYSIYMWHVPIILLSLNALRRAGIGGLIGWHLQSAAVAAGLTATCIAVSAFTYRWIERPFLVRKARIE